VSLRPINKPVKLCILPQLRTPQSQGGATPSFAAAAGGGALAHGGLVRAAKYSKVVELAGVSLTALSDFVIDQVSTGKSFDFGHGSRRVSDWALPEPDWTADLDGTDVGAKLETLPGILPLVILCPVSLDVGAITAESLVIPKDQGLRYAARCQLKPEGLYVSMALEALSLDHY